MRKTYTLIAASVLFIIILAALSYNSQAEKGRITSYDCSTELVTLDVTISVGSFAISADIFAPVFEANFNRLVLFPELGSSLELKGYSAIIRGPPKSQVTKVYPNPNWERVNELRRFSLNEWTRLA